MGKKGTKRKTKWRALPLGEETGGSGNEEDIHDEDQSTTSSVVGGQTAGVSFRRQSFYYKMADKPFRQTRKFAYDKFRSKEPLVKLESKTFDEEEYTKITTPRQDVLFKKGYFGRKKEYSAEENSPPAGEMDGEEEPIMDQIIITNGFVDERGHYLVNGNSYEIYDPYSNTVTVVVGPPPFANGVTQPVLAAVSCQPVPLQPVDWYPPGADWPAQGSAWTPSYPRTPHPDSAPTPDGASNFSSPDPQNPPSLYNQPAYVLAGYAYSESPLFNGVPLQTNPSTEAENSEGNRFELKKTRRKSTDAAKEENNNNNNADDNRDVDRNENEKIKPNEANGEEAKPNEIEKRITQSTMEVATVSTSSFVNENINGIEVTERQREFLAVTAGQVEKQSHSTQTNFLEQKTQPRESLPEKESHSTQTPPEETIQNNHPDRKAQERNNRKLSDALLSSLPKNEGEKKPMCKPQGNRFPNPLKKFREDFPRKTSQQRTNFTEERKLNMEELDSSPLKVSYAKKAMVGLENGSPKIVNGPSVKTVNGGFKSQGPVVNGTHQVMTNGTNRVNTPKQVSAFDDKRSGVVKSRYSRSGRTTTDQVSSKYREKKFERKAFDEPEKKFKESNANGSPSPSEKSSTISELSSPTGLSSGQNTPPEKLIVQKMEEEINKSFEEKLKKNLTKNEKVKVKMKVKEIENENEKENESENKNDNEKDKEEDIKVDEVEEKPKGKKKKNKGKPEHEKPKESKREKKKKKKRMQEETKEKSESENSSEDIAFLSNIQDKNHLLGGWSGLKNEGENFISEMNSLLNGDKEILKSLGLTDDRISHSKLPLHSDLLMMLPTFGWARPKLNIEDFFAPPCGSDLFTKRNITNMKSTKPEEFFASVIESPVSDKTEKKKEQKKASKQEESSTPSKKISKTGYKASKNAPKKTENCEEPKKVDPEVKEGKLGIVEAVNTWLQEQSDSDKFISVESLKNAIEEDKEEEKENEEADQKNGASNPIHAPSLDHDRKSVAEVRENGGCIRVANVISDGFVLVSREFPERKKSGRMYRSSSWDAKLSERNFKKHFKFLTDSASFCQDLISDVRNGLPAGNEYATEELCDPRQTVAKYYTLAPNGRLRNESDSENEVFDALEYKFLTKENQEGDRKNPDGNGNASITDSGVHSDMESSEDNITEIQKEATCKLQ